VLIVINGVETTISVGEARRVCKLLRADPKGGVAPTADSTAAFVLAVAITRGMRDPRMDRLVIREPGAIRALRTALESRTTGLSEGEAQLLEATQAPAEHPPSGGRQVVQPEAEQSD
jgi:hypothetical protein